MKRELCQLRVELKDLFPPIWRRLLVPSDTTLKQLHTILQCAMGWEGSHSYTFETGSKVALSRSWSNETIGRSFTHVGGRLIYLYDPGDGWEHEITLEERIPSDTDKHHAVCLDGERACPPDDCGGVPGYEEILKAVKRPSAKKYAELLEWVGKDFDPDAFSVQEVNRKLTELSR